MMQKLRKFRAGSVTCRLYATRSAVRHLGSATLTECFRRVGNWVTEVRTGVR